MGLLGLRKFIDNSSCTRAVYIASANETDSNPNTENKTVVTQDQEQLSAVHSSNELPKDSQYQSDSDNDEEETNRYQHVPHADHVLIDMNCIIHSAFSQHYSNNTTTPSAVHEQHILWSGKEKENMQKCKEQFNRQATNKAGTSASRAIIQDILTRLRILLSEIIIPVKSLTFCLDGPAPLAKLQTQRLRRRKVALMDHTYSSEVVCSDNTEGSTNKNNNSVVELNTLAITAGSVFMVELENAIAAQFRLNRGRGFLPYLCPVFLFGSTVPGEGEAKISQALNYLSQSRGPTNTHTDSNNNNEFSTRHRHHNNNKNSSNNYNKYNYVKSIKNNNNHSNSNEEMHYNTYRRAYNANDTIVIVGNDIDLVLTCIGATPFHNFSLLGPSSLQIIHIDEILYRWIQNSSGSINSSSSMSVSLGGAVAPITPHDLPHVRIDFIFLFLLNGGDHYVGAGEVAKDLWRRYRVVRGRYAHTGLISNDLCSINVPFLCDVLNAQEYSGSVDVSVGVQLLQSALWSLYAMVTGVCPDYTYVPLPASPHINHLRAAALHCLRSVNHFSSSNHIRNKYKGRNSNKNRSTWNKHKSSASFNSTNNEHFRQYHPELQLHIVTNSKPLCPLANYMALMPNEAALPMGVLRALHSPLSPSSSSSSSLTHSTWHKNKMWLSHLRAHIHTLLSSNNPTEIAECACSIIDLLNSDDAEESKPFFSLSEKCLCDFTSPVQLNAIPRKRKLSRYEQHRMIKKFGKIIYEEPTPVVIKMALPQESAYVPWTYPKHTNKLIFRSPFDREAQSTINHHHHSPANVINNNKSTSRELEPTTQRKERVIYLHHESEADHSSNDNNNTNNNTSRTITEKNKVKTSKRAREEQEESSVQNKEMTKQCKVNEELRSKDCKATHNSKHDNYESEDDEQDESTFMSELTRFLGSNEDVNRVVEDASATEHKPESEQKVKSLHMTKKKRKMKKLSKITKARVQKGMECGKEQVSVVRYNKQN